MKGNASPWRHVLCAPCWYLRNKNRAPVRVKDADAASCCLCGQMTRDGIYVRADPVLFECRGHHLSASCVHVPADPLSVGWTRCEICGAQVKADAQTGLYKAAGE